MKKSRFFAILVFSTCIILTSCGSSKTSSVKGVYFLTKFMYQGWNIADSYSESNITINGVDDNSSSSMSIISSDSTTTIYGHITTQTETDDLIKYKFWVDLTVGDLFKDTTDYIYLYYYPKKETIEFLARGDSTEITFEFQKDSK